MPFDINNPASVKRAASAFLKSLTVIGDSLLAVGDKNYPQSDAFVVSDRHFKDHGPKRMTFGCVSPTRIMLAQSKSCKTIYVSDGAILLGPIGQYNDEGRNFRDILDCDEVLPHETEQIEILKERAEDGNYILSTGAHLNPVYLATALLYLKQQGANPGTLHLSQKRGDRLAPIVIYGPKRPQQGVQMAVIMPIRAS